MVLRVVHSVMSSYYYHIFINVIIKFKFENTLFKETYLTSTSVVVHTRLAVFG